MRDTRDNFSPQIAEALKKRAAFICSVPSCKIMTIAPSVANQNKFQYIGVCAHISAATKGGPRFDKNLSNELRADISNAIFLCNNCSTKIDKNNGIDYSIELLKKWKREHENWVLEHLNKSLLESKNIIQTNSTNQSGGITAHIVNIGASVKEAPINKLNEHDIDLFKKGEAILSETLLDKILSRLQDDESIMIDNVRKIEKLITFYNRSANIFLNESIDEIKTELILRLSTLKKIFDTEFDMFPYHQKVENFKICMKPTVNSDRAGDFSTESLTEHTKLKNILEDNCQTIRTLYSQFRKEVKRTLYV